MTAVAHASPGPADSDAAPQMPDDPDLQLARDPRAGAGRLMVLAGNRPDLRGVIVDNPGCSPELRAWVGRMGVVGSGRSGRSVVETDSIGGSSAGDSGGAGDAGDFGDSVRSATPVTDVLASRVSLTAWLTIGAFILAVAVGIPLGIAAARRRVLPAPGV